jgi:hypothetical protein
MAGEPGGEGNFPRSENGTVIVLEAANDFKILSTIRMGEAPVRSSIAVAHGELFIRTAQNLYCVRNPGRGEP